MRNAAFCITGLALQGLSMSLMAQTDKPNIVIIMTDQQRADLCGREGFPLAVTPYVDQLAQENVWFNKAYTVAPASSPARCSMFTGRFPSATHVRTNHNIPDIFFEQDLVGVLKENGYKTALVGKNHAYLKPADLDFWSEYGHWGKNKKTTPEEKETARFLNQKARGQWLEPSPIPVEEQHPAKIVNETYYSMFSPDKLPVLKTSRKDLEKKGEKYRILAELEDASCPNLEQDLPRIRANYIGMIRLIDDQIKRLIESLKASGQFENTIFVVLSDHGDYWGEYGLIRKGAGLSESLARIPMVWAGYHVKNQSAPMDSYVSIADIFPTLCSAIGAKIPAGVQGRSLWPMLTGKEYPKEEFSSIVVQQGFGGAHVGLDSSLTFEQEGALTPGKIAYFDELNTWTQSGTSRMVRKDDWKLVMDNYGNGELYNLKKDPSEVDNLFGKKKYTAVQTELLTKLVAWELRLQDPLPLPRKRYHFKQDPYNYLQPEQ